ncbi:UPF0149 family protein [Legionella septentrionalis]
MQLHLPDYQLFLDAIAPLALPISPSELHGIICGFLCAGELQKGETYLRTLLLHKSNESTRAALSIIFEVFTISQQQIGNFDFEFQLMLPDDETPLRDRAQAFGEWCSGFMQGLRMSGVDVNQLQEEDAQDALQHLAEFSQLDYESLHVDEEDEQALLEVSEYARLAVLRIYNDLLQDKLDGNSEIAH